MRPLGRDRIGLAGHQTYFLRWIAEKDSDRSAQDVKHVLDVSVIVPRNLLSWADLQFGDAKPRADSVTGAPLDLVQVSCILHCLHVMCPSAMPRSIVHVFKILIWQALTRVFDDLRPTRDLGLNGSGEFRR